MSEQRLETLRIEYEAARSRYSSALREAVLTALNNKVKQSDIARKYGLTRQRIHQIAHESPKIL